MTVDTTLSPYFDDYDEEKQFRKILFRPANAVQVRELNQLQTMLQKQVARFGDHIFEDGSVVIPGEVNYDDEYKYAKITLASGSYEVLESSLSGSNVFSLGYTNGIYASVKKFIPAEDTDPLTVYVKYQDAGFAGTEKEYAINENIAFFSPTSVEGDVVEIANPTGMYQEGETVTGGTSTVTATVVAFYRNTLYLSDSTGNFQVGETITGSTSGHTGTSSSVSTDNLPAKIVEATVTEAGNGSAAIVSNGIYYVNGVFLRVLDQTIVLDKYTNLPSYRVGFEIAESVVTEQDDSSLFDNATGTPNFTAPGAHRLKTQLVLAKRDIDTADDQEFIEILRVEDGLLRSKARGPNYSILEDVMAIRTYDESGDYVVDNFDIAIREHLLEDNNSGVYTAADGGDPNKLVATLDRGKAYVRGYGVDTISTTFVDIDRAQDFDVLNNSVTNAVYGNFIKVTNLNIVPAFGNFEKVSFYSGAVGTDGSVPAGSLTGTARIRYVEYDTGAIGSGSEKYKVYLFDIRNTLDEPDASIVSNSLSIYNSTSSFTADITDSSNIFERSNNTLVFRLPIDTIKTLKPGGITDTTYTITKNFNTTVSSGQILLNAGTDEVFSAYSSNNYVLSIIHTDPSRDPAQDAVLDISDLTFTLGGAPIGTSLTISSGSTDLSVYNGQTVRLVATMIKTAAERVKTTSTTNISGSLVNNKLSLGKADVFELVSVVDDTTGQDVTYQYTLSTGKKENYYDISKAVLSPGYPAPTGTITVNFKYFSHGPGDYFSVDSYTDINYKDIPYEKLNGVEVCLSDVVDFRPRISDDGTGFSGTGSVHGYMPKPLEYFRSDAEYYLNRIDKIYIDQNGNLGVFKGNPALEPAVPGDPKNSIVLYVLSIPAFTKSTEDVDIESVDNRRYTMKDIGKLEQRIKNLEYYTVLSLLEKKTSDMKVLDSGGLDRFKNGFAVDSFRDHVVGDSGRMDYNCSIDPGKGVLRSKFSVEGVDLEFDPSNSSNYSKKDDYIMLPYVETDFVKQPFATRTMNVNPYAVFSWVGTVKLTPGRDTWIDTRYTEPVITNRTIKREEVTTVNRSRETSNTNWTTPTITNTVLNTRWGFWNTNWLGINTNNLVIGRFGEASFGGIPTSAPTIGINRNISETTTRIAENVSTSSNITNKVVDDKVVDSSIIPFMRSKDVVFVGEGLKPFTVVTPFFDNVNVSAHCRPSNGNFGNSLKTDGAGKVSGVFRIPNTRSLRFRTGTKMLRLIDNTSNDEVGATTFGEGFYTAKGVLKTQQKTILSTKEITTHREIVRTTTTNTTQVRWRDPLAESFLVEQEEGMFLTSIDIFFSTKDNNIPVSVEIREMENGYPAQAIIPGGVVTLNPSQVNISANGSSDATTFTFDRPVYLQGGNEYCFVVMANSTRYNIWIATMGERIVGTQSYVSKQPFVGVMFKSQNNSTWSAAQNDDIKFTMRRAKFDTSKQPIVELKNRSVEPLILENNPLLASNGSNIVKVYCPNHGLLVGSKVTISGATLEFGITDANVNKKHTVTSVNNLDVFEIDVVDIATADGFFGGSNVTATSNYPYSVLIPNLQEMVFNNTNINWSLSTKTFKSFDGSESPYQNGAVSRPFEVGENIEFNKPMAIYNDDEQLDNMAGADSLVMRAVLSSSKDNISPLIDIEAPSAIAVSNRINSPASPVETDPVGGDSFSRYVMKVVELDLEATSFKVFLDVNRPQGSYVEVFYRTGTEESETVEKDWTKLPTITENAEADDGRFYENEYGVDNIDEYKFYQVKIVWYATNDAKTPKFKSLRTIALGT